MLNVSGCTAEIRAFARGGTPGLARLKQVLPTIFRHYGVPTKYQQAKILLACRLRPVEQGPHVTFEFNPEH
jgi:hypothetical protein